MPHIFLTCAKTPIATSTWKPLSLLDQPETNGHTRCFAQGSRGEVEQRADRAIKSFFDLNPRALRHELMMCNNYLRASGSKAREACLDGGKLNMPYIKGEAPTEQEVENAVQELFTLGFMMGDPKLDNFKKTPEGKVVPVDFGLIFQPRDIALIDPQVKAEIVHDYVKGGFELTPQRLHADYREMMTAMDDQLGECSPLGRISARQLQRSGLW